MDTRLTNFIFAFSLLEAVNYFLIRPNYVTQDGFMDFIVYNLGNFNNAIVGLLIAYFFSIAAGFNKVVSFLFSCICISPILVLLEFRDPADLWAVGLSLIVFALFTANEIYLCSKKRLL